jgi:isochorismate pyruvate lyase
MKSAGECTSIVDIRHAIDQIDRQIVHLFGQRATYVCAAAPFKTDDASVRALDRRAAMLEVRRDWAKEDNLDPAFVEDLYRRVVDHFTAFEMDRVRSGRLAGED